MGLRTVDEALELALKPQHNAVGMCQKWTRLIYNAPSVGDVDGDGDADAVDGWLSEPEDERRVGDRDFPEGAVLAWSGGRRGFGHRAIGLRNRKVRSTDAPRSGSVGTVDLDWFEQNWGMRYLGWTPTISGIMIPGLALPVKSSQKKVDSRGEMVDDALAHLTKAKGSGVRGELIAEAIGYLKQIKPLS